MLKGPFKYHIYEKAVESKFNYEFEMNKKFQLFFSCS